MDGLTQRVFRDRAERVALAHRKSTGEEWHLFNITEPRRRPYLAALACRHLSGLDLETFLRFLEDYDGSQVAGTRPR